MFEDGAIVNELLVERLNYFIYVVLLLIGLHAMISKRNLIKKLIGMSIFQTAIILFYVSIAVKQEATIPIYLPEHDPHGSHGQPSGDESGSQTAGHAHGPLALETEEIKGYANPLPHVLMLTAIVVGVATLGLALALTQRIFQGYGTIEEDELLQKLDRADQRASLSPTTQKKRKGNSRTKATPSVIAKKGGGAKTSLAKNKKTSKNQAKGSIAKSTTGKRQSKAKE